MDTCERMKPSLGATLDDGQARMEEFCLGIFANADKADRESPEQPPDISLAGRFYVSSLFFDVLTQLFEGHVLPPDLEEKRRYAKYRTLQIRNRKPLDPQPDAPTAPSPSAPQLTQSNGASDANPGFQYRDDDADKSPSVKPPAPPVVKPMEGPLPKPAAVKAPVVAAAIHSDDDDEDGERTGSAKVSRADGLAAKKKLQQAMSAVDFADYKTACTLAAEAIRLMTPK